MLPLTLAVVLVAGSINSRSGGSPVGSESVRILDMYVQDAGHVVLRMLVVGKVHGEVAEVSKCVSLIVVLGPEPQSLVVLDRSRKIDDPEDRLVADDPNRTTCSFDLEITLAVHPIDAVIADSDIRGRPQPDEAASEWLLTAGTLEDLSPIAHPRPHLS
jgi:hypothetical protein